MEKQVFTIERAGKESTSPDISKDGSELRFVGNYCTADVPDFDIGAYFTFKTSEASIKFVVCGGEYDGNNILPKGISKSDLTHSYIITVKPGNATLTILHQEKETPILENESISIEPISSTEVRVIGTWSDTDYERALYIIQSGKPPLVKWVDKGQYTQKVLDTVNGVFKSPPPYRDYPYTEAFAVSKIVLDDNVEYKRAWARQINIK